MAAKNTKQKKKKGNKLLYIIGGIFGVFILLVFAAGGGGTRSGTVKYGICKIILEQSVSYPQTIKVAQVREGAKFARILYSHTDAFGQYRFSRIQCNFEQDQEYANRQWLLKTFSVQSEAGVTIDQITAAANVNSKIISEYMNKKRAKLPDSGAIQRIAQVVGGTPPGPVFVLDSVKIDTRELSEERIDLFQKALFTMVQNPPDLTIPRPLPSNIANYKR